MIDARTFSGQTVGHVYYLELMKPRSVLLCEKKNITNVDCIFLSMFFHLIRHFCMLTLIWSALGNVIFSAVHLDVPTCIAYWMPSGRCKCCTYIHFIRSNEIALSQEIYNLPENWSFMSCFTKKIIYWQKCFGPPKIEERYAKEIGQK